MIGPTGQHDNTPHPSYILVPDQRQSVEPGHVHIRDKNVKRFGTQQSQRGSTIVGTDDFMPLICYAKLLARSTQINEAGGQLCQAW